MRILAQLVTLTSGLNLVFHSSTNQYDVCKKLVGGESPSDLFLAVMTPLGTTHRQRNALCDTLDRTNEALVVVKCEKPNEDHENLKNEILRARSLSGTPWAVSFIEEFSVPGKSGADRCYSMRSLGRDLRDIRELSKKPFDLHTLAAIGAQMVVILESLHNDFGLRHTDVHARNWLVRIDDPTQLALIDYGYMSTISTPLQRIKELQEMIITLRWFTDLNEGLYVPKKILRVFGEINIDRICPPETVPRELKAIIEYIYSLTPENFDPVNDYQAILSMFVSLLPPTSSIEIPWTDPEQIKLAYFVPVVPAVSLSCLERSSCLKRKHVP